MNHIIITYFIVVSVLTVTVIAAIALRSMMPGKCLLRNPSGTRAWLEIDMDHLNHNVKMLRQLMPRGCEMMAVVKANAYGHGAKEISKNLNQMGITSFAVATIDEGIELRKAGVRGDILILGYTDINRIRELIKYRLIQTILDHEYALRINERSREALRVHIKIDTGMHRIGLPASDRKELMELFRLEKLNVEGMYTHLCVCDSDKAEDIQFTRKQIHDFSELCDLLEDRGIKIPKRHIQSSYGLLNYPEVSCDYARIGIALYGSLSSWGDKTNLQPDLLPVLSLKTKIVLIREINQGETVSYGRCFHAERNSRLAVLPIGYADGFPRTLSCEAGNVLLHGQQVPIVGRICMDQLLIDITDVPEVACGDIVTLIGQDGLDEISAAEVAVRSGSIANELLSRLGGRLERVYKQSNSNISH